MSEEPAAQDESDDLSVVETVTTAVGDDGTVIVDDLVAVVDDKGAVVATDEMIAVGTPDGTVVVDEVVSVADDDGNLVPVAEEASIDGTRRIDDRPLGLGPRKVFPTVGAALALLFAVVGCAVLRRHRRVRRAAASR